MSLRRRAPALLLSVLPLVLAACGGSDDDGGCGTDTALRPNAAYTGAYDVTFTPATSGTTDAREFRLSVLSDGTVSGFARDPETEPNFGGTVTGTALDTSNACGKGRTYVELTYTLADGRTGGLSANRTSNNVITGTYPITGELNGTLTIQRTIQTAQ